MGKLNVWLKQQGELDLLMTELDAVNRCHHKQCNAGAMEILKKGKYTERMK